MKFSLKSLSGQETDQFVHAYFQNLNHTVDDYYRKVVVKNADAYEVVLEAKSIGTCMIDEEKTLVLWEFHEAHMGLSQAWLEEMIEENRIKRALVSTRQIPFLSLCLEYQKAIRIESYLFEPQQDFLKLESPASDLIFRLADQIEIEACKAIVGEPYEGYLKNLYDNKGLFVLAKADFVLCMGELRVDENTPNYSDLGMATHPEYRGKGLATYTVSCLLAETKKRGLVANAACDFDNRASKKTLEKAGMMASHRLLEISFESVEV